jgi:hypothetical protein
LDGGCVGTNEEAMEDIDVFPSYHRRDYAAVEALAQRLRDAGLRLFFDRQYLTPGTSV